jgi:hypothetical protein
MMFVQQLIEVRRGYGAGEGVSISVCQWGVLCAQHSLIASLHKPTAPFIWTGQIRHKVYLYVAMLLYRISRTDAAPNSF